MTVTVRNRIGDGMRFALGVWLAAGLVGLLVGATVAGAAAWLIRLAAP